MINGFSRGATCVTAVALSILASGVTQARPHHLKVAAHHLRAHRTASRSEAAPIDGGSSDAPYQRAGYQGPGAEVFQQTRRSAHAPGGMSGIDPDAEPSATGGPSGGLPSNSSGP